MQDGSLKKQRADGKVGSVASSLTFSHSQGLLTVRWTSSAGFPGLQDQEGKWICFRGSWVGETCLSPTLTVLPPLTGFSPNLLQPRAAWIFWTSSESL